MMVLKSSPSIHRNRYSINEEHSNRRRKNSSSQSSAPRSSLDTFVIPRRTRYPSGNSPHPEPIDLQIAKNLLHYDNTTAQKSEPKLQQIQEQKHSQNQAQNDTNGLGAWISSDVSFDGVSKSRSSARYSSTNTALTGSDWSGFSIRHFSASSYGSDRETSKSIRQYNEYAKEHGLTDLIAIAENEEKSQDDQSGASRSAKQWILKKLGRAPSSKNLKDHGEHRLFRRSSIASLLRQRPRVTIGSHSLETLYRLGGTSILHLPPAYRAVHLAIPTCLAATANYLAENARGIPGIFRIPGQTSFVDALYDYYVTQFHNAANVSGMVQASVGSTLLPTKFSYSIHDVACAFKRFLRDVPGGIIGSMSLFEAFREIARLPPSCGNHKTIPGCTSKGKLIALAILSLRSSHRLALISAVFGLLAWLKQDECGYVSAGDPYPIFGPESMGSKALGLCFAPLLLGDLTEKIDSELHSADRASLWTPLETPKRHLLGYGKSPSHTQRDERSADMAASTGKARMHAAAAVVELLVREWEEVVCQLHDIEEKSKSQTSRWSTRNVVNNRPHYHRHEVASKAYGHSSEGSATVNGTGSLSRSVSTSVLEISKVHPQNSSSAFPLKTRQSLDAVSLSTCPSMITPVDESLGCRNGIREPWSSSAISQSTFALGKSSSSRWPSLWAAREAYLVDATSSTGADLAWWERRSEHSLKARTNPEILSNITANHAKNDALGISDAGNTISTVLEEPDCSTSPPTQAATLSRVGSAESLNLVGDQEERNVGIGHSQMALQPDFGDGIPSILEKQPQPDVDEQEQGSDMILASATEPSARICSTGSTSTSDESSAYGNVENGPYSGEALLTPGNQESVKSLTQKIEMARPFEKSPTMIPKPVNKFGQARRTTPSPATTSQYLPRESLATTLSSQRCSSRSPVKLRSAEKLAHFSAAGEQQPTALAAKRTPSLSTRSEPRHPARDTIHARPPTHLPHLEEPPIVRRVIYKISRENINSSSSRNTSNNSEDFWQQNSHPHKVNVGTLYAENRRLKAQLDSRSEETVQLRQRLDALRHFRDSGTLSEKLREVERECRLWKHRARWAERTLTGNGWESQSRDESELH